ncbi:MAG TPA: hypothetical protein VLF94_05740 [Chlamydiales bacterium]|nr:hypothetical protein [Chlamydiales bacterium]
MDFRATRDLDIVLCIEALNYKFVETFWEFIRIGGYLHQERSTGDREFYRFSSPADPTFPEQLELFSRKPDAIFLKHTSRITPIPMDEEISSLSAILLDDDCYKFVHDGKREIDGIAVIAPEYMIPLKARAWLDLSTRRSEGVAIDSKNIKKHKNDICHLYRLIEVEIPILLPESLKISMVHMLEHLGADSSVDLKNLGLRGIDLKNLIKDMKHIYGI